jgi:hypothetical protein
MYHLEAVAKRKELKKAKLLTVARADWAISFYEKLGYRITEKISRAWGFDQYMEKQLK